MATSEESEKKPIYIFKVPVAGDGAVGKTSLIVRYTQGTFTDTYKMTIGTSFAVKTVDFGNVMVKLQIWDLAGQPHFGGVRPLFYQGSTGVIYVYSVIDRASYDHLVGWMEETRKNAGNIPGILIGNKADLADQRVVSYEEGKAYADSLGLRYIETSAKLDQNVGDAFKQIALTIIQTKWPDWIPVEEVVAPTEPSPPTPAPEVPEPVEPLLEEPTPIEPVPEELTPIEPETPEEPEPSPEPALVTPVTIPEEEPSFPPPEEPVAEPEIPPELLPSDEPIEPPPPEEADIIIETKTQTSLFEFEGADLQTLTEEAFEQRTIMAMRRLGVSEVGVLGTFLRSLVRQGQRDVVIQSLESLQAEE